MSDLVPGGGVALTPPPASRPVREIYAEYAGRNVKVLALATDRGEVIVDWPLIEETARSSPALVSVDCISQARLFLAIRDGTWVAPGPVKPDEAPAAPPVKPDETPAALPGKGTAL